MVRYAKDRYAEVELLLSEETGLKIPNSAITEKEFYTVPKDFFMKGGDSGSLGILVQRSDSSGKEQDRRARQVKLTDHGRDQAQEARDHQRAFARDTLAVLDDAEKRQLAAIVLKLNAALG